MIVTIYGLMGVVTPFQLTTGSEVYGFFLFFFNYVVKDLCFLKINVVLRQRFDR